MRSLGPVLSAVKTFVTNIPDALHPVAGIRGGGSARRRAVDPLLAVGDLRSRQLLPEPRVRVLVGAQSDRVHAAETVGAQW